MLPLERRRKLLEFLAEHRSVRTLKLAEQLGVTQETVRRDFEKLEREGALRRTHGGAVQLDSPRRELPVPERTPGRLEEKQAIAQAARSLIENRQTIFLDPGTTGQALAALLPDEPLTVLTNSLKIPMILADKSEIRVVVLGGNFHASSLSCTGVMAAQTANFFRVDAAFLSCRGIDAGHGLSDPTEEQAWLKRHVISRSRQLHVLGDSSKVGVLSSFFFADCSDIDVWITDLEPAADFRNYLEEQAVRIEIAGR